MPSEEDTKRFEQFAFTVLHRRVNDHFRSVYAKATDSLEEVDEAHLPHDQGADAGRAFDLRRMTRAMLELVGSLSLADQLLVERSVNRDDSNLTPMNDRDRQRLRRLRQELMRKLQARFGPCALEILQNL